ncbi:MAG TPA: hypothetical protein VK066_28295 [Chloroflexota bacterium]|nr:hypothetical protein [Chloroflexota bacterium]
MSGAPSGTSPSASLAASAGPATGVWRRGACALACLVTFTSWTAGYVLLGTLALYEVRLGVPEARVGGYPACCSAFGLVARRRFP